MPEPLRSSTTAVALSLRDRLATRLEWHADRITLTVLRPEDVPHALADSDILLCLRGEARRSPAPDESDGGGRYVSRRRRRIEVVCRVRVALDVTGSDLQRLTHDTLGLLNLEDAVFDALEGVFAEDAGGNLLAFPYVAGDFSDPVRDAKDPAWVSSKLALSFEYLRDLTLPE